ncbi:hypothetical protein [Flavisphingomonas formosensis]|uniref:hypothetical protein n=1 Tax=Flavisphingomonas formosensis TaxID=861534 RepID=UPI0012FB262E|nr:hypothetical protein [Sphingomonas formosensis]
MIRLLCRVLGHERDSRRIWRNGNDYRSYCKRCELPLIRESGGWRPYDAAVDDRNPEAGMRRTRGRSKSGINA